MNSGNTGTGDVTPVRMTAAQADELVGRSWFKGYTDVVDVYQEPVTFDEFDAEARADECDDTEMAVFAGGLSVLGTLDLGRDVHSIYVVQGPLRARRLILGDALLIVHGAVELDEWLFGGDTEGIFEVNDGSFESQDPDALWAHVRTPLAAVFDRGRCEFVLRERGEPRDLGCLVPEILEDGTIDETGAADCYLLADKLRVRLLAGRPVFR